MDACDDTTYQTLNENNLSALRYEIPPMCLKAEVIGFYKSTENQNAFSDSLS